MYSYANLSRICRPSYKKKPANVRDWKEWSVLRHIRMFGMCVVGVGRAFLWCPALHTPQPRSICQSEHTGCSPQCCLTHPLSGQVTRSPTWKEGPWWDKGFRRLTTRQELWSLTLPSYWGFLSITSLEPRNW